MIKLIESTIKYLQYESMKIITFSFDLNFIDYNFLFVTKNFCHIWLNRYEILSYLMYRFDLNYILKARVPNQTGSCVLQLLIFGLGIRTSSYGGTFAFLNSSRTFSTSWKTRRKFRPASFLRSSTDHFPVLISSANRLG